MEFSRKMFMEPISKLPIIRLHVKYFLLYKRGVLENIMSGTNYEPLYYNLNIKEMIKIALM